MVYVDIRFSPRITAAELVREKDVRGPLREKGCMMRVVVLLFAFSTLAQESSGSIPTETRLRSGESVPRNASALRLRIVNFKHSNLYELGIGQLSQEHSICSINCLDGFYSY